MIVLVLPWLPFELLSISMSWRSRSVKARGKALYLLIMKVSFSTLKTSRTKPLNRADSSSVTLPEPLRYANTTKDWTGPNSLSLKLWPEQKKKEDEMQLVLFTQQTVANFFIIHASSDSRLEKYLFFSSFVGSKLEFSWGFTSTNSRWLTDTRS